MKTWAIEPEKETFYNRYQKYKSYDILIIFCMKRIILTGAPGTGKTILLEGLRKQGYSVFQESSREVIKEEITKEKGILPWNDLDNFIIKVIEKDIKNYQAASENFCFYDRCLIDIAAYEYMYKNTISSSLKDLISEHTYHKKFFFAPIWEDIYHMDEERRETYQEAQKIHTHLLDIYKLFGYIPIEIPKTSVEKRLEFVMENISNPDF